MKKIITLLLTVSMVFTFFSFSVTADNEIQIGTEIEFTDHHFLGSLEDNTQSIYLIRRSEELQDFVLLCSESNEFITFASELSEDYFSNNALIVIYTVASMNCEYDITSIDVGLGEFHMSTVTVRYDHIEGADDSVQAHLIVAEVNASDVADVEISRHIKNDRYYTEIPFEDHIFEIKELDFYQNSVSYIENLTQFEELKTYGNVSYTKEFNDYIASIDEAFFQTKSIIAIVHVSSYAPFYFDVTNVYASDNEILVDYVYSNPEVGADVMQYTCIMIEVNKSDIISSENVDVSYRSTGSVYTPPYTPPSTIMGDVNGDYNVTATDYFYIKSIMFKGSNNGYYEELFGDYMSRADMNGDGKLTATDYLMVKKIVFS